MIEIMYNSLLITLLLHTGDQSSQEKLQSNGDIYTFKMYKRYPNTKSYASVDRWAV